MIYDLYCRPLWSPYRRKPVYVVTYCGKVLSEFMDALGYRVDRQPRTAVNLQGVKSLYVPVDRYIRPGAIINPTKELRRVLS